MNREIQLILSLPFNILKYGSIIGGIIKPSYSNIFKENCWLENE